MADLRELLYSAMRLADERGLAFTAAHIQRALEELTDRR
jgi:hypothetical protein